MRLIWRCCLAFGVGCSCLATAGYGQESHLGAAARARLLGTACKTSESDQDYSPHVAFSPQDRQGFHASVAALSKPVSGEFFEAPLYLALERLQDEAGVRLMIDHRGFASSGYDRDVLISCNIKRGRLRDVLDAILQPHNLVWVPQPAGIAITSSNDQNANYRPVVVYPVHDLVAVRVDGKIEYDFDSLIHLIMTTVHPESWRDTGTGEGQISPYPSGSIVVTQQWQVHERLAALLEGLRAIRRQHQLGAADTAEGTTPESSTDRYRYRPTPTRRQRVRWAAADS